ncbi:hypothetical protein SZ00_06134 (plasmid) [Rhodococcus sp. AD45]|nr:hypothetical protein SZ00_06134 [Rhodococcus sp. AD45]
MYLSIPNIDVEVRASGSSVLPTDLEQLVLQINPGLSQTKGIGTVTDAQLLITAGGNTDRLKSEASFAALIVPGTTAAEIVLPKLADSLKTILQQRKSISEDVERMLDDHPLSRVLTSMPGIGVFGRRTNLARGR